MPPPGLWGNRFFRASSSDDIRVHSCNFRARDDSAIETYDGPTQSATSKTLEWSFKRLLHSWNLRWAHPKSHLQDYGVIHLFRAISCGQWFAPMNQKQWKTPNRIGFHTKHICLILSLAKRSRNHNFIQHTFDCTCSLPNAEELFQQSQQQIMITSCCPPSS
jgi:hypothetical protein